MVAKRLFDLVASTIALVVLSPLFLAIATAIALDGGRPVFYRGIRIGKDERPFLIWKFRTMVTGAEELGGVSIARSDPRVTRVGRLLRRSKLDELPQLLNILAGEMSIVGPRPDIAEHVAMLAGDERQVLSVRPGLTDYASLWIVDEGAILEGADDPDETYLRDIRPKKLELQLRYVRERNMLVDLSIIVKTIVEVARLWIDRDHGRSSNER